MATKKTKAPKKESGKKISLLSRIIKYGIMSAVVFFLAFAIYIVIAALNVASYRPFPGMNISSDKIAVNEDQIRLLVSNSGKNNIEKEIARLLKGAETFLLIDLSGFPVLNREDEKMKDSFFYRALAEAKKNKPGLYVLIITDSKELYSTEKYKGFYSELIKQGIDIVFAEKDIQRDYRWIYSPAARFMASFINLLPEDSWFSVPRFVKTMSDGTKVRLSFRDMLRKWQGKACGRNMIIAKTPSGLEAVAGAFSMSAPAEDLQIATLLKGDAAAPLFKSELFVAREFLSKKGNGLSVDGETSILRHIELAMKDIQDGKTHRGGGLWMEFLTEGAIGIKLEWMLAGISGGDSVNIIAGVLDDSEITRLISAANSKKCGIKIILDKNLAPREKRPSPPNSISAEELFVDNRNISKDMEIRWLEGCSAKASMVHIFNAETGGSKMLICSSGLTFRALRGYDLSSAIYVEGDFSGTKKLEDVFSFYWKSQDRDFYTSDYTKYAPGYFLSLYRKIIFALKTWSGCSHEVEN